MRLRFGRCVLDTDTREVSREGVRQDLSPKAFQLLGLLLETRPRALDKREIGDRLWPETFVSDSGLPRLIAELRAALGDDARNPSLVRTIHRFGYAFAGDVEVDAERGGHPTSYRLVWGERQTPLLAGENILGRSAEARVSIDLARVSRHHARITVTGDKAVLEDLGSKNGTFLRGQRLSAPAELSDGDEICVGPVLIVFRVGSATTETGASG